MKCAEIRAQGWTDMIDKTAAKLKQDGWSIVDTTGFILSLIHI